MATIDTYVQDDISGNWTIDKDPNAKLDYSIDFSRYLAAVGDTIASVEAIAEAPLVLLGSAEGYMEPSTDGTHCTAWVGGGSGAKKPLALTFRITTDNTPPRVDDRTVFLNIVEK